MVYFRFPFTSQIVTTDKKVDKKTVRFVSFDKTENIDFLGSITAINTDEFLKSPIFSTDLSSQLLNFKEDYQNEYVQKLTQVISFIKKNSLPKLVISRRKLIDLESSAINLSQTFLNLCDSYPNAFVYFLIEEGKCWLGAFSELLGRFDKSTSQFETMSLAGTISVNENWTHKEIDEQQPVTDFISSVLKNYSEHVEKSDTCDHISGNIKHLRNDFQAKIKVQDLEKVIAELHPTPAVCGIPKEQCAQAIERFEDHPRSFYAGYIKVETEETIQYFVNLRCAQFFNNAALVYVGGGITADSNPDKEWQETEMKAEAILNNLSY